MLKCLCAEMKWSEWHRHYNVSLETYWPSDNIQKEDHGLPNRSLPWVTETIESKTADNRGLLYSIHLLHLQEHSTVPGNQKIQKNDRWLMSKAHEGSRRKLSLMEGGRLKGEIHISDLSQRYLILKLAHLLECERISLKLKHKEFCRGPG